MSSLIANAADPTVESPAVAVPASRPRLTLEEIGFWLAHAAFWMFGFAAAVVVIQVFRPTVGGSTASIGIEMAMCFVATAAIRWLSRHEPLLLRLGVSKIGVMAGGAILSAVLITLACFVIDHWRAAAAESPARLELVARLVINLSLIANWCALYFGFQLIRERNSTEFRALQAESLALRHELQHLQGQISPHFLFNALNTVMASRDDPEAIDTVTQALANYLRFLLRPTATLESLARELDALEEYLTVQGMRFGDGLVTRIECDTDARRVAVPPVMVQPLVENAIKYGGETAARPIQVNVAARREGEWLVVEVANMGRWVPPGGRQSTGTGLHSLERRLRLLVGPTAAVTRGEADGWVRVLIRIPIQRSVGDERMETTR